MTKITLKSHFLLKNMIILSLCTQRCYGRHNVSKKSGLSILLHGVILLPDATSCDNNGYCYITYMWPICVFFSSKITVMLIFIITIPLV